MTDIQPYRCECTPPDNDWWLILIVAIVIYFLFVRN